MQVLEDVRLHAIVLERCRNAQKNYKASSIVIGIGHWAGAGAAPQFVCCLEGALKGFPKIDMI